MVYLTTAYPFYFAAANSDEQKVVVFEIDATKLDERRLHPDEDFIAEVMHDRDGKMPTEAQKDHIRENLDLFRGMWPKSLAELGNCAYR